MANAAKLLGKDPIRMLVVGYPGAGKTGALASLVDAGFKLRVLDFEGNTAPLLEFSDPKKLENVDIVTLQDKTRMGAKFIEPEGIPQSFNDALKLMKRWKYTDEDGTEVDLGSSADWGPDTVVVVDSMTAVGDAALARAAKMMNKTRENMTSAVWGAAVADQQNFFKLLGRKHNRYHLIVLAHLRMIGAEDFIKQGDDDDVVDSKLEVIRSGLIPTRLYPRAVTKNASLDIHKDFSTMILAERKLKLGVQRRVLRTVTDTFVDSKFPAKGAPEEVPLETGMLTLFKALGAKPPIEAQ